MKKYIYYRVYANYPDRFEYLGTVKAINEMDAQYKTRKLYPKYDYIIPERKGEEGE